jgi:hypothetical protein
MEELSNNLGELEKNQKGVSNTTIAVLVILALLISIIGTWAVLNSIATQQNIQSSKGTNVAIVSLSITNPDSPITTGVVTLEIKR